MAGFNDGGCLTLNEKITLKGIHVRHGLSIKELVPLPTVKKRSPGG